MTNEQAEQDLIAEAMGRLSKWREDTNMRCCVIDPSENLTIAVAAYCTRFAFALEIAANTEMPSAIAAEGVAEVIDNIRTQMIEEAEKI